MFYYGLHKNKKMKDWSAKNYLSLEEWDSEKYERYMKISEKFFLGGKTFIVLPPEFFEIIDLGKVELWYVLEIAFFV